MFSSNNNFCHLPDNNPVRAYIMQLMRSGRWPYGIMQPMLVAAVLQQHQQAAFTATVSTTGQQITLAVDGQQVLSELAQLKAAGHLVVCWQADVGQQVVSLPPTAAAVSNIADIAIIKNVLAKYKWEADLDLVDVLQLLYSANDNRNNNVVITGTNSVRQQWLAVEQLLIELCQLHLAGIVCINPYYMTVSLSARSREAIKNNQTSSLVGYLELGFKMLTTAISSINSKAVDSKKHSSTVTVATSAA